MTAYRHRTSLHRRLAATVHRHATVDVRAWIGPGVELLEARGDPAALYAFVADLEGLATGESDGGAVVLRHRARHALVAVPSPP